MIKKIKFIKKENEASRLLKIAKNSNSEERINHIAKSEFKRMIYLAELAALRGETTLQFQINISEKDNIYFNLIIHKFTDLLYNEGFTYMRNMLKSRNSFSIYFSQPMKPRKIFMKE